MKLFLFIIVLFMPHAVTGGPEPAMDQLRCWLLPLQVVAPKALVVVAETNATGNLRKVVAGGQSGVDQAGLRAARKRGLETGGWCPPDCRSLDGPIPAEFGLKPTPEERSTKAPDVPRSLRTEWNVRDSDATLILRPGVGACTKDPDLQLFKGDPGTAFTIVCAQKQTPRALLVCDPNDAQAASRIVQWLRSHSIETLNVAGPAESSSPGIGAQAESLLLEVFNSLRGK